LSLQYPRLESCGLKICEYLQIGQIGNTQPRSESIQLRRRNMDHSPPSNPYLQIPDPGIHLKLKDKGSWMLHVRPDLEFSTVQEARDWYWEHYDPKPGELKRR